MKIKHIMMLGLAACLLGGCAKDVKKPIKKKEAPSTIHKVSLSFTGDILIEDALYAWMGKDYDFKDYFAKVKPYLDADVTIGNQEVVLGGKQLGITGSDYTFNAPKEVADQLPSLGFDVLTFANNHSYDRGMQGITNTLANLKKNHIQTTGAYTQKAKRGEPLIIESNGVKLAILAYTYDTNQWIDEKHSYAVNKFLNADHVFDKAHQKQLKKDIAKAKRQADVILCAMHWGTEFTYELNAVQKQTAAFLNQQGVDIIIGNHPHCLQTVETLKNKNGKETFVLYSLGNFVSAAAGVDRASETFTNMYEVGGIVNCDLYYDTKSKQVSIKHKRLIPIVNHFDANYDHFQLIPFADYTEKLAAKHGQRQVSTNFTKAWLTSQLKQLFDGKIEWQKYN